MSARGKESGGRGSRPRASRSIRRQLYRAAAKGRQGGRSGRPGRNSDRRCASDQRLQAYLPRLSSLSACCCADLIVRRRRSGRVFGLGPPRSVSRWSRIALNLRLRVAAHLRIGRSSDSPARTPACACPAESPPGSSASRESSRAAAVRTPCADPARGSTSAGPSESRPSTWHCWHLQQVEQLPCRRRRSAVETFTTSCVWNGPMRVRHRAEVTGSRRSDADRRGRRSASARRATAGS